MPLPVKFILTALMLYSTAIWAEKIKKNLKIWMVIVFAAGFTSDLIGTTMMMFKFDFVRMNLHAFCGIAALVIMGLHLLWAIAAKMCRGKYEVLFHRFSLGAWAIWLVAFITGIPR